MFHAYLASMVKLCVLTDMGFSLQGLEVLQSRCTSVTRRAAGLPMLILCVVSAEEASKARPLLAHSIHTLLDTARSPLPQDWDQTLDLPQVIHIMNSPKVSQICTLVHYFP